MREIKFRIWYKPFNRMSYAKDLFIDMKMVGWSAESYCEPMEVDYKDFELMQYTGLKDKNGKEIYEGDIIENYQAPTNEVFCYSDGSWCYSNFHASALPLEQINTESEVIGNIYENGDLL
tara:strand:- start:3589 stop:3948 length:360 start_codon:yes stop_codon:yes gene_type:complete